MPPTYRRILVSRTDKIGDLLLSLPVFQSLKASFPRARITALVSHYAAEVVRDHPAVNRVELYDPGESILGLAGRIRKMKADAFVALYPRPRIALAAALAGVRMRVGTAYRWYSFLFNRRVKVHRSACDRHEAEYNLDLARVLGASRIMERIRLPLRREHLRFAARYLKRAGVKHHEKVVAVHPGHKKSALNWSVKRYAEAVSRMARWRNVRVLLTGSREERPLLSRLSGLVSDLPRRKRPIVMAGECGLKELAALYKRCSAFLSGSTGTMHLAASVGTPVVALFCPIPTATPVRWGPWTRGKAYVLMPKKLLCPGCQVGSCRRHDPMDAIPLDEVLAAVRKLGGL
jgi:ADP-heptose:LPS heptosyltransferase